MHANLFTDHYHVILFFACLIFMVDLGSEIILTAKFSRSTVYLTDLLSLVSRLFPPPDFDHALEVCRIGRGRLGRFHHMHSNMIDGGGA